MKGNPLVCRQEGVSHISRSHPFPLQLLLKDSGYYLDEDLGNFVVVSAVEHGKRRLVLAAKVQDLEHCDGQPGENIRV